eukprot:4186402-Pleurochrysis_carterae.AAC.2
MSSCWAVAGTCAGSCLLELALGTVLARSISGANAMMMARRTRMRTRAACTAICNGRSLCCRWQ